MWFVAYPPGLGQYRRPNNRIWCRRVVGKWRPTRVHFFPLKTLGYDSHFAGTLQAVLMQGTFVLQMNKICLVLWHFGTGTKVKRWMRTFHRSKFFHYPRFRSHQHEKIKWKINFRRPSAADNHNIKNKSLKYNRSTHGSVIAAELFYFFVSGVHCYFANCEEGLCSDY